MKRSGRGPSAPARPHTKRNSPEGDSTGNECLKVNCGITELHSLTLYLQATLRGSHLEGYK